MSRLSENWYGKGDVRVTKVVRHGHIHTIYEFCVTALLGGDFEGAYTDGDNSAVIPTDTIKNTVYALARKHDFTSPEAFGQILTSHFVERFGHVAWASADLQHTLWARIPVKGQQHPHAFTLAGSGLRIVRVRLTREGTHEVSGGISGLLVLKTTKSAFTGFVRDEYTTLKDTADRIFATNVDAVWNYEAGTRDFNACFEKARETILEVFAEHDSLGVQQTIYAIGETVLARVPSIRDISLTMPNQHRILANLAPLGLTNENEIFVTTTEPFGLIKGTIARG